ncbi:MAG: response regulator [Candidatus Omnitrophica bacterium]|nr:response regulator [Candidatus Omnitrophota bacterium]
MKILVVDDSLLDRKLLIRVLMKAGVSHEILQAENGEQAMEILAAQYMDIGLLMLDWQMPKVSGIELMAGMVKIPELAQIPIIMVTASGSEDNKRAAYQVNPRLAGFLAKPYKPEDLLAAVQPHLK